MWIYRKTSLVTRAELVPVCYVWDYFLKKNPNVVLWAPDGNHASPSGSYLAACTFYWHICGKQAGKPSWRPTLVDGRTADAALRDSLAEFRAWHVLRS